MPNSIDPSLLRAGRFDRLIRVPPPDDKARRQILHRIRERMGNWDKDVDIEQIVKQTLFCTGADIQNICARAASIALLDITADKDNKIRFRHFASALEKKRES